MAAGVQELLGDIQATEVNQDFRAAKPYYNRGLELKPH